MVPAVLAAMTAILVAAGALAHRSLRAVLIEQQAVRLRAQAKPIVDRRIEHLSGQIQLADLATIIALDLTTRETTANVVDAAGVPIATAPPQEGPEAPLLPAELYARAVAGDPHVNALVTQGKRTVLAVLIPPLAWRPHVPAVIELSTDITVGARLLRRALGVLLAGTLAVTWAAYAIDSHVGAPYGVIALAGYPIVLLVVLIRLAGFRRSPITEAGVAPSAPTGPPGTIGAASAAAGDFTAIMRRVEAAFLTKQASEQRMRRFIADASHELRTPLTSLSAAADLLIGGAGRDADYAERIVRVIRSQTDRMEGLVNDLLTLARLDSGHDELPRERVRLDRLVHQLAEELAVSSPDRRISVDAGGPVVVAGDPGQLRRALVNLTSNAVRHTGPGGSISMSVVAGGDGVLLVVCDDGEGIAADDLPRIFERFFRGDPARGAGGSGLGLAIVNEIVRVHGGRVEARSRPREGASFHIMLPLAAG